MKFPNQFNEIFFNNIIKHDLTMYEWKVITTFVTDSEEFNISLKEIERRTGIAQPNISKSLKGLVYQGILIKDENRKYILSEALLDKDYSPSVTSSSETRRPDDSSEPKSSGNFKRQAELKREKNQVAEANLKKMYKEKAEKKRAAKKEVFGIWLLHRSQSRGKEISILIERTSPGYGQIKVRENPADESQICLADFTIIEEVCREILGISAPGSMLAYVDAREVDNFLDRYHSKKTS